MGATSRWFTASRKTSWLQMPSDETLSVWTVENSGFLRIHLKDFGSHKGVKSHIEVDTERLSEGFRVA